MPTYVPPKGCTGFLTVQMHGCVVSNHYTCDSDPNGNKWRVDINQGGPFFVSRIDSETQWLDTYDLAAKEHDKLVEPQVKPASFSTLLATGVDSYDFTTIADDGTTQHVTGTDKLNGVKRVLNGITLEQTEFDTKAVGADGKLVWQSKGNEWINREWRLFLSGAGTWTDDKGSSTYDSSPAALILPGKPGFFASAPEFDCNTVLSQLSLPPQPVLK